MIISGVKSFPPTMPGTHGPPPAPILIDIAGWLPAAGMHASGMPA
jgi:hypothetical protein